MTTSSSRPPSPRSTARSRARPNSCRAAEARVVDGRRARITLHFCPVFSSSRWSTPTQRISPLFLRTSRPNATDTSKKKTPRANQNRMKKGKKQASALALHLAFVDFPVRRSVVGSARIGRTCPQPHAPQRWPHLKARACARRC